MKREQNVISLPFSLWCCSLSFALQYLECCITDDLSHDCNVKAGFVQCMQENNTIASIVIVQRAAGFHFVSKQKIKNEIKIEIKCRNFLVERHYLHNGHQSSAVFFDQISGLRVGFSFGLTHNFC